MRLATLNTWKNEGRYPRRLELIAAGLAGLDLDVLLLQEAFVGQGWNTASWLGQRLGLQVSLAPARWKLRLHEGQMMRSASGLAILSREVIVPEVLSLSAHPDDGERIAMFADVSGGAIRVLNLHLTHLQGPIGDELRRVQLSEALEWAGTGLKGRLILGGDLNAAASADCLKALWVRGTPPVETGSTTHGDGPAIDHLVNLAGSPLRVERILRLPDSQGVYPSDHCGLFSDTQG